MLCVCTEAVRRMVSVLKVRSGVSYSTPISQKLQVRWKRNFIIKGIVRASTR